MVDRNRTDIDRGANLYRDFVQGGRSEGARQSPFIDRERREEYLRRAREKESSSAFATIGKVAALSLGAWALGRTIPKDVWVESLHKLGHYGKNTFGAFMEARNEAVLSMMDHRHARAAVSREAGSETELSRIFREELRPFLADIDSARTDIGARQQAERMTKNILQKRFARSHVSSSKHAGLTVGDLNRLGASHESKFDVVSKRAYEDIMDARQRLDPTGKWFDKLVVDRHLYVAQQGKIPNAINAKNVRDLRWASKRALGQGAYKALGFQIPFVGFKPVDLFAPLFRHFAGEGPSVVRVGAGKRLASDVVTPRGGSSYIVGGDLMHFGGEGAYNIAPGRKFTARTMDAIGQANKARLGLSPLQAEGLETGAVGSRGTFWGKIQDALGMGPKFRTQPQVFQRFSQAARRAADLKSGKQEFRFFDTIRAGDLPFKDRLRHQARAGGAWSPDDIVPNPYAGKSIDDLGRVERAAAFMGTEAGTLGGARLGEFIPKGGTPTAARPLGQQAPNWAFFEDKLSTKLFNTAHFATNRLNDLIGSTIGIGFRPSMGNWGFLYNGVKLAALGAMLNPFNGYAVDAYKYVDYLFKSVTSGFGYAPWEGVGPTDVAIKMYEGATLAAAAAKDMIGFTMASRYVEDLMPGTMSSQLSGIARTAGGGYLGARAGGAIGMGVGILASGIGTGGISDIFGTPILGARSTDTAANMYDYYFNQKEVAVKSSRWWMLGRQDFQGEGIDRFEPHWVSMAKSDWQYTNTLYGSRKEYFEQQSTLPTPHNLFSFGKDEDYFANKLAGSRPYPIAPSGAAMHEGESLPMRASLPRGLSEGELGSMGMHPLTPDYSDAVSAESFGVRAKTMANTAAEFLGVYKFMGEAVFGKMQSGPQYASASDITDANRMYWDQDMGGLFGMTELLRRYMVQPNDIGSIASINQIPNQMPNFMPGSLSAFEGDQGYYKDFTLGDPYTKVKGGEYRLPGAAYEATHQLHSGQRGVYDEVDAFKILADVAPYSQAYNYYKNKVLGMVQQGQLTTGWQEQVQRTMEQRDTKIQGYAADFMERRFTGGGTNVLDQIAFANDQTQGYNIAERTVGAAYETLTMDALPEIGRAVPFGTLITHKMFPHHTAEQDYYERQVMGSRFSDWADPWAGFIRPRLGLLYNENPATASAGGALMGLAATSPFGMIGMGAAGAVGLGTASALRGIGHGRIEGGYTPGWRDREMEAMEQYDKLEYLRYQNAADQAQAAGNVELAGRMKRMQRTNTMAGLDLGDPGSLQRAYTALPRPERFYYDSFRDAPPGRRDDILDLTPSYMDDIYQAQWNPGSIRRDNDAAVAGYFSENPRPTADWPGWNMGIQKWELMAKMNDTADNSMAVDLNRQHISTMMIRQASQVIPDSRMDHGIAYGYLGEGFRAEAQSWFETAREKINLTKMAIYSGARDVRVSATHGSSTDTEPRQNVRVRRDRSIERNLAIADAFR